MGTMLSRQSAQKRMNSGFGMSFAEFCYQIFQAYDWLYLFQNHNCRFQVGGSDQMGNIMSGQELISRTANVAVYGLTLPLITTVSGDKFGKSAGNAVWLNAEKTSPFELYQYFLRTQDADVERFLQLFTFENLDSIKHIMKKHREKPENQYAQKMLADQVTLLVHGEEGLQLAHHTTLVLYSKNIEILGKLTPQEISQMFKGAAVREILLQPGLTTLQLALQASCFPTEGDAKRIMQAGGFYINNQRVTNIDEILIYGTHILPNNLTLVRVGFCGAALLYTLGIICNKMVGAIYTDSHGETVKISYVNFWGRRVDIVCPASDILPLSELPDRLDDLYVNLKQYSTDETLRCTFRYGSITDLDNFQKVFGNLKE